MQPIQGFVRDVMEEFYFVLTWIRRHQKISTFPLSYPNPEGEFYGYDHTKQSPFGMTEIHTTQVWTALVCFAATGIICLKAGKYVWKKRDCALEYKTYINDEWTEFIEEVCEACFNQWKYRIPDDSAGRRKIRELCERTPAFENHFLTIAKDWLLSELEDVDDNNKLQAVRRLGKIIYPDKNVLAALRRLENDDNEELREAVKEAIEQIQQFVDILWEGRPRANLTQSLSR